MSGEDVIYFEDLTPYKYYHHPAKWRQFTRRLVKMVNIGWLDDKHHFPQAEPSEILLAAMFLLSLWRVNRLMGYHSCPFCDQQPPLHTGTMEKRFGIERVLGSAELRVIGWRGKIYVAPNLIYHYIKEHHYRPPQEFINALYFTLIMPLLLIAGLILIRTI